MKKIKKNKEYSALISRAVQILTQDVIIEGSVSQLGTQVGAPCHLTFKEDGRTKTVYLPQRKVEEMKQFVENWKMVKVLLKEASAVALSGFREALKEEKELEKAALKQTKRKRMQ